MTAKRAVPWDRPVPIGFSRQGTVELSILLHALLGGATGAGKSVLLHSLLAGLAQREHTQFVLIDPKRVEFPAWQWGDRAACIATGAEGALEGLRLVRAEMMRRYEWCEDNRVKSWPAGDDRPRLVVVIDELAELTLGPESKEIVNTLQSILAMGRAAGVLLIDATQRPDATVVPTILRDNHRLRICLGTESAEATKMILGPEAGKVPCHQIPETQPGRGWIRIDREFTEFRSFFISADEIEAVISATAHLRRDLPGFPAVIKQPLTAVKGGKAA